MPKQNCNWVTSDPALRLSPTKGIRLGKSEVIMKRDISSEKTGVAVLSPTSSMK